MGALSLGVGACAAQSPRVKVLGVEQTYRAQPRASLVVFVEVVNPTQRNLRLSRLEYRVRADSWFESRGKVALSREIGAGSSAVVEIPVPVDQPTEAAGEGAAIPYILEGKLFAREDKIERSWRVAVRGALSRAAGDDARIRVTVAP